MCGGEEWTVSSRGLADNTEDQTRIMLAERLGNIPMTVVAVLAASVILLALLLALAFRGRRNRDPEKKWDTWRTVRSALIFIAGPFPISIAIHLAVLLFLIHEVRQVVAPEADQYSFGIRRRRRQWRCRPRHQVAVLARHRHARYRRDRTLAAGAQNCRATNRHNHLYE